MAKYEIKYLCGHSGTVQLFGKNEDRERKIKYYEFHYICPDCYKEQFRVPTAGCEEVEMFYRDYKNKCPQCETKPNSYDPKKKTIIVYVPKATGTALPDYGIEGLNELRAAIEENNAYQESFHQMMANEGNDGIYPPKTPQYSVAELMRKYPSAAAYLEAEEYSESENYAQSTIGEKALNRMRTGEDCLLVQKEMQNEWTDYCHNRILDQPSTSTILTGSAIVALPPDFAYTLTPSSHLSVVFTAFVNSAIPSDPTVTQKRILIFALLDTCKMVSVAFVFVVINLAFLGHASLDPMDITASTTM